MLKVRIIPCLLLKNESLVKTIQFKDYNYIGDPINTVRIFNELEVDELVFLDIRASRNRQLPNFKILHEISNECFMPLSYGGGVRDLKTAERIFSIGFEKIVINSFAYEKLDFIGELAKRFGSQSIIGSIDIKKNLFGRYSFFINDGQKRISLNPIKWAKDLENSGVGELMITSMNNEGTWGGFDEKITGAITQEVSIPVIANGGGGNIDHIVSVVENSKVSAVALGSMVVYQKKDMGVLVNFPNQKELARRLS